MGAWKAKDGGNVADLSVGLYSAVLSGGGTAFGGAVNVNGAIIEHALIGANAVGKSGAIRVDNYNILEAAYDAGGVAHLGRPVFMPAGSSLSFVGTGNVLINCWYRLF